MSSQGAKLKSRDDRKEVGVHKSFREQIQLAKQELNHHFQEYHRMLYGKEQSLISELDDFLISADDLHEKRRELKQTQGELEEKMKRNDFQVMKDKLLEVVNTELCELEHQLTFINEREVIELEWRDSELLAAIRESCVVLKRDPTATTSLIQDIVPYTERQVPLWSVAISGPGDGQLHTPRCVAVDDENEDIYVADKDNHRMAVFNKNGLFIRNFTVEGMKWPYGIVIVSEFCYISTDTTSGLTLKANKKTGKKLAFLEPGVDMVALTFDKETGMLFSCLVCTNSVWNIHPRTLEKISELTLYTPHFTENSTKIYDLKTLKDELYVLFLKSPYPLQSFSRNGNLLRTIISQDSVSKILHFCIDLKRNLIVSDVSTHKVLVFSLAGKLIATIGREKTEKREAGELYCPRGLALMKDSRFVVCDGKSKNRLQFF